MQKHASFSPLPIRYEPIAFEVDRIGFTDPAPVPLPNEDIRALHFHDCIELGVCRSGSGIFLFGERMEALQAGDALYIPPMWHHYSQTISVEPCICEFVYLRAEGLGEVLQMRDTSFAKLLEAHAQPIVFRPNSSPAQAALLQHLPDRVRNKQDLLCVLQFAELLLQSTEDDPLPPKKALEREDPASLAAEYMALHYREKLNAHTLATVCHLSESQLRRRFTALYGEPPHAHLNRLRCRVAARMLRHTARSVEDISEAVGYASSSDLYRHFKSIYGVSPNTWRRNQ